jgi:mRNA interferase MazF
MVKPRPVIVVSPREEHYNKRTCIVVALSTTAPSPVKPYHVKIELPGTLPNGLAKHCWVKGDMIYSLSLNRMDFYRFPRGLDGKRKYYYDQLHSETMKKIRKAVGYALGYIS